MLLTYKPDQDRNPWTTWPKLGGCDPQTSCLSLIFTSCFFLLQKNCLSAQYDQVQFTNNHHFFQEISGIWCSNCGASSDLWLTSCCRASRPFPQQGPEWSAGLSSNDITLSHSCSLYFFFDFFLYDLFFVFEVWGASRFPTQDWIYAAGFWARCSFVFFLSKHGIFMLVCSIISLSCK